MEKKALRVKAVQVNMTETREEVLEAYKEVEINAVQVLMSPRTQLLAAQYGVAIKATDVLLVPEGCRIKECNGTMKLGAQDMPDGPAVLQVNGLLTLLPGSAEAVAAYERIMVNGELRCPRDMKSATGKVEVNGVTRYYDPAAVLLDKVELNDLFLLRAANGALYDAARLTALDEKTDWAKAAAKGLRFEVEKAVLCEAALEAVLPCVNEEAKVVAVPAGMLYTQAERLSEGLLMKDRKLFVDGDFVIDEEGLEQAQRLEALTVTGTLKLDDRLKGWAETGAVEFGELELVAADGKLDCYEDIPSLTLTAGMLRRAQRGVKVSDCARLEIAPDAEPELLREKLAGVSDCAIVTGSREQLGVVSAVSEDVARFAERREDGEEDDGFEVRDDLIEIKCVEYTL